MRPFSSPSSIASTLLAGALLASCAAVPDLGPQPVPRAVDSVAASRSLGELGGEWPAEHWWRSYGDSQLDSLIAEALASSPDMAIAAARLRAAEAVMREVRSPLRPSVGIDADAGWQKQSYNMGFPKEFGPRGWNDRGAVSAGFNWNIDIWGRNRAALAAATSEADAAAVDLRQAQLILSTEVAAAYVELARSTALRDVAQESVRMREAVEGLVRDRMMRGLDSRGELRQAEANTATARSELAATDEAIALNRNRIAALVGAGPDRGLRMASPSLKTPAISGLPNNATTDLVGRRPDVVAARMRAEAAASRIKVARADFFPAISLGALVGVQSLGLNTLVESDSIYGNVGPAISLPIFRGGALSARYRSARAGFDEAVATYDNMVLVAYREVADAVTSRRMLAHRLSASRAALKASEESYAIARLRYEGGLSAYLDVLVVEERLIAVRQAVADLDARAFNLDVALVRALGGGWDTSTAFRHKDDPNG